MRRGCWRCKAFFSLLSSKRSFLALLFPKSPTQRTFPPAYLVLLNGPFPALVANVCFLPVIVALIDNPE